LAQHYPKIAYLEYVPPPKALLDTEISDIVFYEFDSKNPNSKYNAPNKVFEALAAGEAALTGDVGRNWSDCKKAKMRFYYKKLV
jgi:hypothetical protein